MWSELQAVLSLRPVLDAAWEDTSTGNFSPQTAALPPYVSLLGRHLNTSYVVNLIQLKTMNYILSQALSGNLGLIRTSQSS